MHFQEQNSFLQVLSPVYQILHFFIINMTSAEDLLDALNCIIRFTTPEGDYEGILQRVFVPSRMLTISKIIFLQSNKKLGTLNFMFDDVTNIRVLNRPNISSEGVNETSLICFRSDIDDMFNLDGDSENESVCKADEISNAEKFEMKLLPCFSNCVSSDSQIINSFNNEFNSAIEHISSENLIGVSLEGPKVDRNGTLTWLCISTSSCTYLFDILALGEESFQKGLKSILENSKIKKIFHDCRLASDCLFHQYNVCLVNVFDTQAADSFVMMLESKNCSIVKKVNSLDTCLGYYLQLPEAYLYGPVVFDLDKKSLHYYGLRPLDNGFRGAMIKNVIYLRLLKREIETALMSPLRRATDVYLNVIQNATDRELMVAPPVLDELPPELLLEGIQIIRYQEHEFIPPIVSSGPPCRKLVNPIKDFVESCKKFQTEQENKCLPSEDTVSQNRIAKEIFQNVSNKICTNSSQSSSNFSEEYVICQKNAENTSHINECNNINCVPLLLSDSVCIKESFETEMSQIFSMIKKATCIKTQSVFGDISLKAEQSNENKKNVTSVNDSSQKADNFRSKKPITDNTIAAHKVLSDTKLVKKLANDAVKNSCHLQKSNLFESECKVSKPVGNCLLRGFNEKPSDKDLELINSTVNSELFSSDLDQEKKLNVHQACNTDWEVFCNEIRKESSIARQSDNDQNSHRPKLRFVPAGMAYT